ncbi:hypothetical protein [Streptomyces olivaceoviridis]|uniref:hypothetical protein n=1 Tax=Streptomyces olivaceoviridis TaxID=1921 RepID=UPI0037A61944
MIRIVTAGRLRRLEQDAEWARDHARKVQGQADATWARHVRELHAVTDRAERAEKATSEVGVILAQAVKELSVAQQELLLKDIEIRRLQQEQTARPAAGQTVTVLLRHGEPHTVYRCREDAYADTATHGVPAGTRWLPADEHPTGVHTWRLEAFIYDPASKGFRRAHIPLAKRLGEAA